MMPKTKGHIFVLLAFLVLLGMIVSPVCANNYTARGDLDFFTQTTKESYSGANAYTYDASAIGDRISMIQFTVDTGQYVNFTIYYGTGATVTGSAENRLDHIGLCGFLPCPVTESIITLNGVSKSYQYGDIQPLFDFDIAGYGIDNDNASQTGFLAYDGNYGKYDNDLAVFYPVSNIGTNLIYKIDISGSQTFSVYINHGKAADVAGIVATGLIETVNAWVSFAVAFGGQVFNFVLWMLGIIKFFFIDNLLYTLALYFSVTLAYSAMSSVSTRGFDVFRFYKVFFGFQRGLLKFMMEVWGYLVQIVSEFRGIFRL